MASPNFFVKEYNCKNLFLSFDPGYGFFMKFAEGKGNARMYPYCVFLYQSLLCFSFHSAFGTCNSCRIYTKIWLEPYFRSVSVSYYEYRVGYILKLLYPLEMVFLTLCDLSVDISFNSLSFWMLTFRNSHPISQETRSPRCNW